jgi:hypothetical protein
MSRGLRNLSALVVGVVLGGLLVVSSAHASSFTGSATEGSTVLLGVGIVLSFALGWIAGGQR